MIYLVMMLIAVFGWMAFLEREAVIGAVRGRVVSPQGKHVLGSPRAHDEARLEEWAGVLHVMNINGDYARLARL